MRTALRFLLALIVVAAVIVLIRTAAVTTYRVTSAGMESSLHKGESVMVDRWSYGWRMPFGDVMKRSRVRERDVRRGDVVVFNSPNSTSDVLIGRCAAVPGDAVFVDSLFSFSDSDSIHKAVSMPVYLPEASGYVEVQPWNVMLLRNTLALYEGKAAEARGDTLFVGGKPVRFAKLTREYFWIASDNPADLSGSKIFGLVPKQLFIGKAQRIWLPKSASRFLKKVE